MAELGYSGCFVRGEGGGVSGKTAFVLQLTVVSLIETVVLCHVRGWWSKMLNVDLTLLYICMLKSLIIHLKSSEMLRHIWGKH